MLSGTELSKRSGRHSLSDGANEELKKFLASENFNFKKQASESEILLTYPLKEGNRLHKERCY